MEDNKNDFINVFAEIVAVKIKSSLKSEESVSKDNGKKFFTVSDICEKFQISKATFYRHQRFGFIKPTNYVGRKPLYDQQAIDEYLKKFS